MSGLGHRFLGLIGKSTRDARPSSSPRRSLPRAPSTTDRRTAPSRDQPPSAHGQRAVDSASRWKPHTRLFLLVTKSLISLIDLADLSAYDYPVEPRQDLLLPKRIISKYRLSDRTTKSGPDESPGEILAGIQLSSAAISHINHIWQRNSYNIIAPGIWGSKTALKIDTCTTTGIFRPENWKCKHATVQLNQVRTNHQEKSWPEYRLAQRLFHTCQSQGTDLILEWIGFYVSCVCMVTETPPYFQIIKIQWTE